MKYKKVIVVINHYVNIIGNMEQVDGERRTSVA